MAAKDVPNEAAGEGNKENESIGAEQHAEVGATARKDESPRIARAGGFDGEGAADGVDAESDGKDGERFSEGDADIDRSERAEHGESESDFGGARPEMAAREGGEQETGGEIGSGLREKDGVEPGVGPDTREKLLEDSEKDGIAGKTVEGRRDGGAVGHAIDAVMKKVVAEFEVVACVVVDGAGKVDEDEAQDKARGEPEQPAARPAGWADDGGHTEENTGTVNRGP